MRVLITGANGFIGRQLVLRLLETGTLRRQPIDALLVVDRSLNALPEDGRLRRLPGDVTEPAVLRRALADGVDVVFHLAGIPGAIAERDYELGYRTNLLASLELMQLLRAQPSPAVLVFASSVSVYGDDLPPRMNEEGDVQPALTVGAHKQMVETALVDLSRRGEVDGRAIRLPSVVARPDGTSGLLSGFMSELLNAFERNTPYCCPVSPEATGWWMSVRCCVANLIQAAELDVASLRGRRVWQLPVLKLSVAEVIEALVELYGEDRRSLISHDPNPELEAAFGAFPPLRAPQARALGFSHDRNVASLIRNALTPSVIPRRGRSPARIKEPLQ